MHIMCSVAKCVLKTAITKLMKQSAKLWFSRVGWLMLLWLSSVLALGLVAYLLRLFMQLIGLK